MLTGLSVDRFLPLVLTVVASCVTQGMAQTESSKTNADCVSCENGRIYVPPKTGDEAVDNENMRKVQELIDAKQAKYLEQARAIREEKYNSWEGTAAVISSRAAASEREHLAELLDVFHRDLPTPVDRLSHFIHFFDDSQEFRCVRWNLSIQSSEITKDGEKVTVIVAPQIIAKRGGIPYTPSKTTEVWIVHSDGTTEVKKVTPNSKQSAQILMVD